jgi:hypothetical protein
MPAMHEGLEFSHRTAKGSAWDLSGKIWARGIASRTSSLDDRLPLACVDHLLRLFPGFSEDRVEGAPNWARLPADLQHRGVQ